jgi:mannose/fructose/N-acetylgalactosamine-specific phosphotransferase system component IIC
MSAFKVARDWMATSTLVHVGFAFLAMGAWAAFANRAHPLPQVLLAGAVQGAISGLLTLGLKTFLEWINARLSRRAALIAPPVITAVSIVSVLIGVHTLAGTPEIAVTIAVPFTVSTSYACVYNFGLWRRRNGR